MKEKRIIVTASYLIEAFGGLDPKVILVLLAPFMLRSDDAAIAAFRSLIADLKSGPKEPSKTGAIEAVEFVYAGYLKISVFERERIRKELPTRLANHLYMRAIGSIQ